MPPFEKLRRTGGGPRAQLTRGAAATNGSDVASNARATHGVRSAHGTSMASMAFTAHESSAFKGVDGAHGV